MGFYEKDLMGKMKEIVSEAAMGIYQDDLSDAQEAAPQPSAAASLEEQSEQDSDPTASLK